jgi:hypothetical protein
MLVVQDAAPLPSPVEVEDLRSRECLLYAVSRGRCCGYKVTGPQAPSCKPREKTVSPTGIADCAGLLPVLVSVKMRLVT